MSGSTRGNAESGVGIRNVFGPILQRRTYLNLLYLLIALPVGFVYYMGLFFGFFFGLLLSVVGIGFGILLAVVLLSRVPARFEYVLAEKLLAVEMKRPPSPESDDGTLGTIKGYLDDGFTWQGLAFISLKFWMGLLILLVLFILSSALSLLTAIVRLPHAVEFGTLNDQPLVWTIETIPEAAFASLIGAVLTIAVLHLINALGYIAGRMAVHLLGDTAMANPDAA